MYNLAPQSGRQPRVSVAGEGCRTRRNPHPPRCRFATSPTFVGGVYTLRHLSLTRQQFV